MRCKILCLLKCILILCCATVRGEIGKCREGVSKDLTSHQLLMQDVFCSYDKGVRPVLEHTMNLTIKFQMLIKFFTFDDVKNVLKVHSWIGLTWKDAHLKWSPRDYGNISFIQVNNQDIWQPDFAIYNSGHMDSKTSWTHNVCLVDSEGTVVCVPVSKWTARCVADLQQWPYDKHDCTMIVGSWAHPGEMIDIVLQDGGVDMSNFRHSREWNLLNLSAKKNVTTYDCCPNETYPSILFKFALQRHSSAYAATVIIPSLVLAVMTLASFWLDPKPPHRLALCSISVLCHCLYLQYLGVKLPSNGTLTPVIIIFFRDSLVLSGIALVLSVMLQRLSSSPNNQSREATPEWLNKLLGLVLEQRIGHFFLLGQWDSKNTPLKGDGATLIEDAAQMSDSNNKPGNEWFILATIVDRLAFFTILLTYSVLLICLIPSY